MWHLRSEKISAVLFFVLFFSFPVAYSQQHPEYQIKVIADPGTGKFSVSGSLRFVTDTASSDSIQVAISKTVAPPILRLQGLKPKVLQRTKKSGDIAYTFVFRRKLKPGTNLKLHFSYERGNAPTFQYYIDSNFVMAGGYGSAWYPQLVSDLASGNGDYLKATGKLTVTTPLPLSAVMASSIITRDTSLASVTSSFTYLQPDIFSVYIGRYAIQEFSGSIPFYTYHLNDDINGKELSEKSAAVLNYLKGIFGSLAIPSFSIIEFPDYVAEKTSIGGASLLGGILMPTGALRSFNYALFGHELGHQWWGNKVMTIGTEGAALMTESMAQYGSLQVVEHFDSAHAIEYRRNGYPGYIPDQSGIGYLKNEAAGNDEPLVSLTGSNQHMIGDSKGFLALDLLSQVMGKDKFHRAATQIGEKYGKQGLSFDNFIKGFEKEYGQSLQWFTAQWFRRTGAPAWTSSWKQEAGTATLTIKQKQPVYTLPLDVQIVYTNGKKEIRQIHLNQAEESYPLAAAEKIDTIIIDPYFRVLHWDESLMPRVHALAKLQRVIKLRIAQKPDEAAKLAQRYLDSGIVDDPYGLEFSLFNFLGRMSMVANRNEEALDFYLRSLRTVSRDDKQLALTYYRITLLASRKNDKKLMDWASANAIKADRNNNFEDGIAARISVLPGLGASTKSALIKTHPVP